MKQVGTMVSEIAFGTALHKDAAAVLNECRWRCLEELGALGLTPERASELVARAEKRLLETVHLCESPIEQMLLAAMSLMVIDGSECFPPSIHDVMSGEPWPGSLVTIVPQFVVARFRLDFLVVVMCADGRFSFAVECDGLKHHSNVSDRARDAERDYYLRCLGIKTIRLKGDWIYKNQWRIADEIEAIIKEKRNAA